MTDLDLLHSAAQDPDQLNTLVRHYRPMLLAHLVCDRRVPHEEAEDVLQEFLMQRIVAGPLLQKVDRTHGGFRSYLIRSLENFHCDHVRRKDARKRAPEQARPFGDEDFLPSPLSADQELRANAALALDDLREALRRLQQNCVEENRPDRWGVFDGRVLAELYGLPPVSYEDLARTWRLASAKQAANNFVTVRNRFMRYLLEVRRERRPGTRDQADDVVLTEWRTDLQAAGPELLETLRALLWGQLPGVTTICEPRRFTALPLGKLLEPRPAGEVDLARTFRQLLELPVLSDLGDVDPRLVARLRELASAGGPALRSLGEVLRHPQPGVELLDVVKQFAKDNSKTPDSPLAAHVAVLLYFLCIACGLVRHGARLTTHSEGQLRDYFHQLLCNNWIEEEWKSLLREARNSLGGRGVGTVEPRGRKQ